MSRCPSSGRTFALLRTASGMTSLFEECGPVGVMPGDSGLRKVFKSAPKSTKLRSDLHGTGHCTMVRGEYEVFLQSGYTSFIFKQT